MSWLDRFFTGGIKNVAIAGALLPQEVTLNFVTGATGVDNAAQSRSDVSISVLSPPTGTGFLHMTAGAVDVAARAVNLATADVTGITPVANGGTNLSVVGANGTILTVVGGVPAWTAPAGSVTWAADLLGSTNTNQWVAAISGNAGAGGIVPINATTLRFAQAQAAPTISQAQQANASNPNNLTLAPQAPGAAATNSTTGTPGSVIANVAIPVTGGAEAFFAFQRNGTTNVILGDRGPTQAGIWVGPGVATVGSTWALLSDGSSLHVNAISANIYFEVTGNVYHTFQATGAQFNSASVSFGGGNGVIGIGQATTVPTSASANGLTIWANTGSPGSLGIYSTGLAFHKLAGSLSITQDQLTTDVVPGDLTVAPQKLWASATTNIFAGKLKLNGGDASAAGSGNGGRVEIRGGNSDLVNTATAGTGVLLAFGNNAPTSANQTMLQLVDQRSSATPLRQLILCGLGGSISYGVGAGDGGIWLQDALVAPTGGPVNVTSGLMLWSSSAAASNLAPGLNVWTNQNGSPDSRVGYTVVPRGSGTRQQQSGTFTRYVDYRRTTTSAGTYTYDIPVPNNTSVGLYVTLIGRLITGGTGTVGDTYLLKNESLAKNIAGTVTVVGTVVGTFIKDTNMATASLGWTVSTTNVRLTVTAPTGEGATPTIDWTLIIEAPCN